MKLMASLLLALLPGVVCAETGLDLSGVDRTVAPGDEFFDYANGAWAKSTEIPADRATWGASTIVAELTAKQTAELIQDPAHAGAPAGSPARLVADFYATWMDAATTEAKGLGPLRPRLEAIAALRDRQALARHLGGTLRADVDAFNATDHATDNVLGVWVAQDLDHPERYAVFLMQGGLDMPQRSYYLDDSPRMAGFRAGFRAHAAAVMKLLGSRDPEAAAARIVDLETRLARAHAPREESEDIAKSNNRWAKADFPRHAPGLDWDAFFAGASLQAVPEMIVWQPSAVRGLATLVAEAPLEAWRDYLSFHAAEHFAAELPAAFGDERFAFHGTTLTGTPRQRDRWKRAVTATSAVLGDAVGQLYVAKHFSPAARDQVREMVENIKAAFGRRIDALAWMAPETKKEARAKLAVLKVGVGYPDRWRDTTGLQIVKGDALGNLDRAEQFAYHQALARLGQPVDRDEWVMAPQVVNAVNLPALNAMNFPAAILQPPYFDPRRPAAMNYGAIGSVIGHEISHSFDDQGALFDSQGRLRNWWTPEDKKHFEEVSQRLVAQYDAYKPFPDLALNGRLTLGENIADVAGLAATWDAWKLSLGGRPAEVVDGLTGDQQFFLAFAQGWRGKARDAMLRQQVLGDGHAPGRYRVATVRNLDAWYDAFGVKPGQALYLKPEDRVRIW